MAIRYHFNILSHLHIWYTYTHIHTFQKCFSNNLLQVIWPIAWDIHLAISLEFKSHPGPAKVFKIDIFDMLVNHLISRLTWCWYNVTGRMAWVCTVASRHTWLVCAYTSYIAGKLLKRKVFPQLLILTMYFQFNPILFSIFINFYIFYCFWLFQSFKKNCRRTCPETMWHGYCQKSIVNRSQSYSKWLAIICPSDIDDWGLTSYRVLYSF